MTTTAYENEIQVHNPADVERHIEETKNRIARGVRIISDAEEKWKKEKRDLDFAMAYALKHAEGPEYLRKAEAVMQTMPHREKAENAELAYKHAERQADALNKELFAWQSILNSVRAMYNAAGVR